MGWIGCVEGRGESGVEGVVDVRIMSTRRVTETIIPSGCYIERENGQDIVVWWVGVA